MAKKKLIRVLDGDWTGVDYYSTDLTRPSSGLSDGQNMQFGQGGGLVGRRGFQVEGARGAFTSGHVYSYLETDDGSTTEEVLAANDFLWRRVETTLSVTYSGAGTWYYTMTLSGSDYIFTLYANGSAVLTKNCGTGQEAEPVTLWQLSQDIENTANFAVTNPPMHARVNGNQSGVSSITIVAGHTLAVGDYVQFYDHLRGRLTARILTTAGATTMAYTIGNTVDVKDAQDIGPSCTPAASIRLTDSTTAKSSTDTIPWSYWEPIKFHQSSGFCVAPFELSFGSQGQRANSYANANDVCFIGHTRQTVDLVPQIESNPDGRLMKYDGNRVYRAGVPTASYTSFTPGAGSNNWRYMVTYQMVDHRGNIIEGEPSEISTETGGALNVTCVIDNLIAASNNAWFNIAGAIVDGAQSGAGTQTGLTVDTGHTLRAGDIVSIYDGVTGEIVRRELTSVTATTLVWASTDAISVADNDAVSCGMTWKVWRTKNNGVDFYLTLERPNDPFNATTTISDSTADTDLAIKYEWAEPGEEHNLPPCMNYLAIHQGCLVGAGDRGAPNTVSVSLPGYLEYFPTSSSSFDVPSSVQGAITSIATDSDNRLAVFKQNAYYDVEGDLAAKSFTVRTVHEGDYGVVSHSSVVRLKDRLIGIGALGPIVVSNGSLLNLEAREVRPAFTQQAAQGNISSAFCANDARNLMLRVHVNSGNVVPAFVADYEEGELFWFNWSYGSSVIPQNGIVVSSMDLFNIGENQFFRELNLPTTNGSQSLCYNDAGSAITYRLKTTAHHGGMPEEDKMWTRLRIWNLLSEFDSDEFVSFTPTIKTYRNRSTTEHTSTTESFSSASESAFEKTVLFKSGKAQFLAVELTVSAVGERPMITGYSLQFVPVYDEEHFSE